MIEYRIGDVFDRLAEIPDGSIDLIVTSPPFLALRSYLPADHPDKAKEIGSEPTPAEFLDTLYALTAEWGRVLAPHGSICVELGDTYAGGGVSGWHRDGYDRSPRSSSTSEAMRTTGRDISNGWPLAKSLTGIPTLYPWGLAYGRNLLTGQPHDAGQWRIRNVIVWARPNPPVGALGDKFRPATSYITVACKGQRRYFDLDAVRTEHQYLDSQVQNGKRATNTGGNRADDGAAFVNIGNPAGAPPLDWHADDHPEDGDWLWKLSTQPYKGSHYATFPLTLPKRLIEAMCPLRVCTVCGKPSERIVDVDGLHGKDILAVVSGENERGTGLHGKRPPMPDITRTTTGWTDCGCPDIVSQPDADTPRPYSWISPTGHLWVFTDDGSYCVTPDRHNGSQADPGSSRPQDACSTVSEGSTPGSASRWRTGIVLDPFAGSGTTLEAAQAVGRHAIGIDLDQRNADLARDRVGMFLEVAS